MTTLDSRQGNSPHPLDPDTVDSDREATGSPQSMRYPHIEPGRTFPLSLLVFLFTVTGIFFAIWRFSAGGAIASLCLVSPGLIYTMWVVEQRRLNGEATPFSHQAYLWGKSTAILGSCLAVFAITFTFAYALTLVGFYFGSQVCLGESAGADGIVMGSIVGLPIACYGSIFSVYGLVRLTWGRHLIDSVDIRN